MKCIGYRALVAGHRVGFADLELARGLSFVSAYSTATRRSGPHCAGIRVADRCEGGWRGR